MITHAHLTAWQTHAPWPRRSQVEQDLRLSRGVAAIFADPVLGEHLAMRGGTVLHKGHLAPAARYSEDIDLVLVKTMSPDELDRRLRSVLTPVLGRPADSLITDAWLTIRNVLRPSKILRTSYKFVPLGLQRDEVIKVEVNLNESAALYPLVAIELDSLDEDGEVIRNSARSYNINEMLGTKTRALMQREQGVISSTFFTRGSQAKSARPLIQLMAPRLWKLLHGISKKRVRACKPTKRMASWTPGCARRRSGGIWIRCCARDYRNSM